MGLTREPETRAAAGLTDWPSWQDGHRPEAYATERAAGGLPDWPLWEELQAVVAGQVCGPVERARCRRGNGTFADWACRVCREFLRPEAISPWTWHLLFLYRLSCAGYPFRPNDLTLETWLLLDLVRRALTSPPLGGPHVPEAI